MSEAAAQALRAVKSQPKATLLAVDFDGTLSPIVDDPAQAYAHPDAIAALGRLGHHLGTIAIITGRPAMTAVKLGHFKEMTGLESLVVLGQYGAERWEAATDHFEAAPEPKEISEVEDELPALFAELGLTGVRIEHKGRAIGVHTRELDDSQGAFDALLKPLRELASKYGLHLEPGKNVLEIRGSGIDKGDALRRLLADTGASQVIFAGDDLGDLPAFEVVRELRDEGHPTLLVCSASEEQDALAKISDLVLDGPQGVAEWLTELADSLDTAGAGSR
ncbi:trehalose-phosphatase [Microlunatus panaciterrae]|nr:trehalose-phosphatase [Microlunatus panaciterrae]